MKRRIFTWIIDLATAVIICIVLGWNKPSMILLAGVIGYVGIEVIDWFNSRNR